MGQLSVTLVKIGRCDYNPVAGSPDQVRSSTGGPDWLPYDDSASRLGIVCRQLPYLAKCCTWYSMQSVEIRAWAQSLLDLLDEQPIRSATSLIKRV